MSPVAEEATALEVSEGDTFYAVSTYAAESEETMHLVEGERVYILGKCRERVMGKSKWLVGFH